MPGEVAIGALKKASTVGGELLCALKNASTVGGSCEDVQEAFRALIKQAEGMADTRFGRETVEFASHAVTGEVSLVSSSRSFVSNSPSHQN